MFLKRMTRGNSDQTPMSNRATMKHKVSTKNFLKIL